MLKVYYCPKCYRVAYFAKSKASCIQCNADFQALDVPYLTFIDLNPKQRMKALKKHSSEVQTLKMADV